VNVFRTWVRQFLSKKEWPEEIPEREGNTKQKSAACANTTDRLFHRHGPDLLIGGESLQHFLDAVLDQGDHPLFHRESQHIGSS
jgi:hypothetical protein